MIDAIEQVKKVWKTKDDRHRREFCAELLAVYRHDWRTLLDARMRELFSEETYQNLRMRLDTSLNLLAWYAEEMGGIYAQPAVRTIGGEENEGLAPYINDGELDAAFDEAARVCVITREIFLRPLVVDREGERSIVYDIVTPDKVAIIPHPQDPLAIQAIVLECCASDAYPEAKMAVWTPTQHWMLNANWQPCKVYPLDANGRRNGKGEMQTGINPYGVIPYVPCFASYPAMGFWHAEESNGLLDATYHAGIQKTDHNHLRHFQSFKQLYIRSDKEVKNAPSLALDPAAVIQVRGQSSEVGAIDLQANLREHLDTLLQGAQATLALYGIRPEAVRGQAGEGVQSGYALQIKNHRTQRIKESYAGSWVRNEKRLYAVARRVAEVDELGASLPDGVYGVEHADMAPPQNPTEQAALAIQLKEAGWSEANIMREVWGKDNDWIEANVQERLEEQASQPRPEAPIFGMPATNATTSDAAPFGAAESDEVEA